MDKERERGAETDEETERVREETVGEGRRDREGLSRSPSSQRKTELSPHQFNRLARRLKQTFIRLTEHLRLF